MTQTDAEVLADELAARLAAVVPAGIAVAARRGSVEIGAGGHAVAVDLRALVEQPGDADENAALAAHRVLDAVQDCVAEQLAEPWPPGGDPLPPPGAAVDGALLRLWYGDEDRPALELPPIPLRG